METPNYKYIYITFIYSYSSRRWIHFIYFASSWTSAMYTCALCCCVNERNRIEHYWSLIPASKILYIHTYRIAHTQYCTRIYTSNFYSSWWRFRCVVIAGGIAAGVIVRVVSHWCWCCMPTVMVFNVHAGGVVLRNDVHQKPHIVTIKPQ